MRLATEQDLAAAEVCAVPCFNCALVESIQRVLPPESTITAAATRYSALADKTRLKILLALTHGELCVCDIAHVLDLSISATSHQLRLLRNLQFVQARNDGRMVYYSLCADEEIDQLLSTIFSQAGLAGSER